MPLAQLLCGTAGLRCALLCAAANSLAAHGAALLLCGSAGAPFPAGYRHQDGGVYDGQWVGALKEGFGKYAYPSGARYEGARGLCVPLCEVKVEREIGGEQGQGGTPQHCRRPAPAALQVALPHHFTLWPATGEWLANQKDGRGVYYFPMGGVYEGEWKEGRMEGVGVRTHATGRVQVRCPRHVRVPGRFASLLPLL